MIHPQVKDEFSRLKCVILGIADSCGGTPMVEDCYDPKSKEHVRNGSFPLESELIPEMESFAKILEKYDVDVRRPQIIKDYNQIFSRDIGLVIEDKFIITNMIDNRAREIEAIQEITQEIPKENIIKMPKEARLEGGDLMPMGDKIFIGYSKEDDFHKYQVARTNEAGVQFIQDLFPDKTVYSFELNKSDEEAKDNALHLDCCFQPLGLGHYIIYPGGFKNEDDVLLIHSLLKAENGITITRDEMYDMGSNFFSIDKDIVVSEASLDRINQEMRDRGYTVEEVKYCETAKMEGLLRCSTLPLIRQYS